MLLLKLLQKLIGALNSEGTPGQVAAGLTLGAAWGLTPLLNLHNLVVLAAAMLLTVSFPAVMLGWMVFTPLGYLLDPAFDQVGTALLSRVPGLVPTWTVLYNMPVVPLSNYNNTVVLGSLIGWVVLALPIYMLCRYGVVKYRAHLLPKVERLRIVKAVKASKLYTVYSWFRVS